MAAEAALMGWAISRRRGRPEHQPLVRNDDTTLPSWSKLTAEFPAALRLMGSLLLPVPLRDPAIGGGRPVLVIPAFLASDILTLRLRRTLKACGFIPYGWAQGFNGGVTRDLYVHLSRRVDEIIAEAGGPIVVIGWSLGGIYARELAKRRPTDVSLVITLGSPFSVDLRHNNSWKLYEALNRHPVDDTPVRMDVPRKPPVFTVAVWSPADGIVAPASASGKTGERDEQVTVGAKHNELVSDPDAIRAVIGIVSKHARADPGQRMPASSRLNVDN